MILVIMLLLILIPLEAGQFSKTCYNVRLWYHGELWANCEPSGQSSKIPLDNYVSNDNGEMVVPGNGFSQYCYLFQIFDINTNNPEDALRPPKGLGAWCKNEHNKDEWSSIVLDDYIENIDGNIQWTGPI
ncbi:hypothetical protein SELMODRAFT_406500 [Selaginella moellendorffii]|uniref:Cyanovirin-N domain-containing protein n=1 Tax=Selaginella moellendorffii TaxID=88036 RepID=D8R2K5_SELML|nr:hypothetical protein SELMODRAFT_406500 [Selaginella moellendorffii]